MKSIDEIVADKEVTLVERAHDGAKFHVNAGLGVLVVIVSNGGGWDHASVSVAPTHGRRMPLWDEMCFVKRIVWRDDECVVQYHPPEEDYVNVHPLVLHLWKPQGSSFLMPPKEFV
jgi:hypothetical protein